MNGSTIKILATIAIAAIILQILTSLVYSNQIIKINKDFSIQRKNTEELKRNIEILQNQLSLLESINRLNQSTPSANLKPITHTLNLNE